MRSSYSCTQDWACPRRAREMIRPVYVFLFIGAVLSKEAQVTKREKETVTLYMNRTVQNKDYLWTFGRHDPVVAITIVTKGEITRVNGTRFGDRLSTHVETASITISNLTINDSGIFLIQVFTENGILMQRFNLSVHDNSPISYNVLEGNNATLDTEVKQLQKDHNVKWTQGPDFSGDLIAQWKDSTIFIEKSFEGVLQLNPRTGSLTFMSVTKNYTNFYCVMMLLGGEPHILRQYSLTVFDPVSIPHISRALANMSTQDDGTCNIDCQVKNGPEVVLSWYRGEKKINQTCKPDTSPNLTLPLEIQDQNEVTYRCVARNPVSTEAASVNSTQWCPSHAADSHIKWIIVGVVVGVLVVCAVLLGAYLCRRRNQEGAENCFSMRNMQETQCQCTAASEGSTETMEQQVLLNN